MNSQLTYREKFTAEMTFGGVPCDTEWLRNSNLFKEGLEKFDSGEWKYFEKEVWKDIVGFEGKYQVSNHGGIRTLMSQGNFKIGHRIKKIVNEKGYHFVQIYKVNKKRLKTGVHRLVALTFIPNPENKPQVNHKNGIKTDNHVTNLEWATNQENQIHAYANNLNTPRYGHESPRAKLSKQDVLEIRTRIASGDKNADISNDYKISMVSVRKLKKGITYKNT